MLKLFKPFGEIESTRSLYGDLVEVIGIDSQNEDEHEMEIRKKMESCDILLADVDIKVNKELVENASNLKAVVCTSIGVDYVNIPEMTEKGIIVANNPDFCIEAVAEYAISLMFTITRKTVIASNGVRDNNWLIRRKTGGKEIIGKTMGLIGFGRIGREVARMCKGLGMNVIAYDPFMNTKLADELKVKVCEMDYLLRNSDFISIHIPLTDENRNLINRESFESMKDGVYLINVSRGGIINEKDLIEFVKKGKFGGVGLDVLEHEPPNVDDEITKLVDHNLIVTPHTAWYTYEAEVKADLHTRKQIEAIVNGKVPESVLNKEVLNH